MLGLQHMLKKKVKILFTLNALTDHNGIEEKFPVQLRINKRIVKFLKKS